MAKDETNNTDESVIIIEQEDTSSGSYSIKKEEKVFQPQSKQFLQKHKTVRAEISAAQHQYSNENYSGIFTNSTLERLTGINQRQLQRYAPGTSKPHPAQAKHIEQAFRKLGHELQMVEI